MRICLVSHTSELGGAERALLETVDALGSRGVEFRVVVPKNGPLVGELQARGIHPQFLYFPWWVDSSTTFLRRAAKAMLVFYAAARLARRIHLWRCDIVYTNTIAAGASAIGAWLASRPHVWHLHEFGASDHDLHFIVGNRLGRRLVGILSEQCLVNSKAVKEFFASYIPTAKLTTVYYSMALFRSTLSGREFRASARGGPPSILIAGTLQRGKGQVDAIKAVAELARRGQEAKLFVAGSSHNTPYEDQLRSLVRALGVEERVFLCGEVEDLPSMYAKSDLVVVCSRSEAFGRVAAEAMIMGVPVVGAAAAGTKELIQNLETGLLYEPRNHLQLADQIEFLLRNSSEASRMSENALDWVNQNLSEEAYGDVILNVLRRLVSSVELDQERK